MTAAWAAWATVGALETEANQWIAIWDVERWNLTPSALEWLAQIREHYVYCLRGGIPVHLFGGYGLLLVYETGGRSEH